MRRTYCVTQLDMIDVTAQKDATVSTDDNQSFGNLTLFEDYVQTKKYGTLALNQNVLNATLEVMDNVTDVAFMSNRKSTANCTFENNPSVEIAFTKQHTSAGLMLYFGNDYPAEIKITWYSLGGIKIISEIFKPNTTEFVAIKQVENYSGISIEFVKTRLPYSYATLQFIRYGYVLKWERSDVSSAKVLEEIDRTGATLSINTANIDIIDTANDFDIQNNNGRWRSVQKTQKLLVTEYYNDIAVNMGTFYLDSFSFSGNTASFRCKDAIGLLDNFTYREGKVYGNVTNGVTCTFEVIVKDIFDSISSNYNVDFEYTIEDDLKDLNIQGYLAAQTARSALQMACFAVGAVVDDSRSDVIRIYRPSREIKSIVGCDRKFDGATSIKLDTYVSGVSLNIPNITLADDMGQVYQGNVSVGTTIIDLSMPIDVSTITIEGVYDSYTADYNYIKLTTSTAGEITISAKSYNADTTAVTVSTENIEAGQTANIMDFSGSKLYSPDYLQEHAKYLLDYYSLRQTGNITIILEKEQVSEWITLKSRDSLNQFATCIESSSIDLTGGYLATLSLRGYSKVVSEYDYTGEIYTNQTTLL